MQQQNNRQRQYGLQSDSLATIIPSYVIPGEEWVKKVRMIFNVKGIPDLTDVNLNPILLPILLARVPATIAQIAPVDTVNDFLTFVANSDKSSENIQEKLKLGQGLDRRPSFYYYLTCQHMSDKLGVNDPRDHTICGFAWQLLKSKLPNEMKMSVHTLQIGNHPTVDQLKVLDDTWTDLPETLRVLPPNPSVPKEQNTTTPKPPITSGDLIDGLTKAVLEKVDKKLETAVNTISTQNQEYINNVQNMARNNNRGSNKPKRYRGDNPQFQNQQFQQSYQNPPYQQYQNMPNVAFQTPQYNYNNQFQGQQYPQNIPRSNRPMNPQANFQPNFQSQNYNPRPTGFSRQPNYNSQPRTQQTPFFRVPYKVGKTLNEDLWYSQNASKYQFQPAYPMERQYCNIHQLFGKNARRCRLGGCMFYQHFPHFQPQFNTAMNNNIYCDRQGNTPFCMYSNNHSYIQDCHLTCQGDKPEVNDNHSSTQLPEVHDWTINMLYINNVMELPTTKVYIKNQPFDFIIDSGAVGCILTPYIYKRLDPSQIYPYGGTIRNATGTVITVDGQIVISLQIDG